MTVSPDLPPSPLLTENQAAAYLTLQPSTLRAWRYRGGGPRFVPLGRAIRYRVIDLDAWLEGRVVSNTSEAAALEADDQVDTIPRAPRMAPKRPKKSPPPPPVDAPPDVQAAPGEPSPAMVADMVRDAALEALVSGLGWRRAGARRAVAAAMASGARTVRAVVAAALTPGAPGSDQVDAGEEEGDPGAGDQVDAGEGEGVQAEEGDPGSVDVDQLAAAAVARLISEGWTPDDAAADVDIALEGVDRPSVDALTAYVRSMAAER